MARRSDADRLSDILAAAAAIKAIVPKRDQVSDPLDRDIHDRALRQAFMEIGEATKGLSVTVKSRHPQVRWKGFSGFRDVLIHQYHRIDPEILGSAIENDLPRLVEACVLETARLGGRLTIDDP